MVQGEQFAIELMNKIDAAIARAKDNTPVLANKEPET